MSKKHPDQLESIVTQVQKQTIPLQSDSLLDYHRKIEDIILDDELARLARIILLRGRDFSKTRFPMYTGLVAQMRVAYDRRSSDKFLTSLAQYLKLAGALLPGAPVSAEKQKEICTRIGELITKHSISAMGRALLVGLWG